MMPRIPIGLLTSSGMILVLFLWCVMWVAPCALAASSQGTATATIETPLTLETLTDLHFGTMSNASAGQVSIDPQSGQSSTTGGLALLTSGNRGTMLARGTPSINISATLTNSTIQLQCTVGGCAGRSMTATLTLDSPDQTDVTGDATVGIGGTLSVDDSKQHPAGSYAATYEVNVHY